MPRDPSTRAPALARGSCSGFRATRVLEGATGLPVGLHLDFVFECVISASRLIRLRISSHTVAAPVKSLSSIYLDATS
jgi:hypothetical protein